jgi:hypothetical protein
LGYHSNQDMIRALFDKKIQDSYGIRLVEENNDESSLSLRAPISRHKAHKRASRAPLLQFKVNKNAAASEATTKAADILTHTGYIRSRTSEPAASTTSSSEELEDQQQQQQRPRHQFLPLSAALRVSQKDDVDTGRIEEGSIHPAVVFDYDSAGDGGSPLLTLSLNPGGVRESLKIKPDRKYTPIEHPKLLLDELTVGAGPYNAKVIRLEPGKALIDCEVGRKVSSSTSEVGGGGMVKVFGSLRFQDALEAMNDKTMKGKIDPFSVMAMMDDDDDDSTDEIIAGALQDLSNWDDIEDECDDEEEGDDDDEEDDGMVEDLMSLRNDAPFEEGTFEEDEEEEDITDCFQMNEDGTLVYTDPETGEKTVVVMESESDGDEDDEDDEEDEEEDDEEDEEEDALLDDDEEDAVDDITDLLQVKEDGSLSYTDPETDETVSFGQGDAEYADMMMVKKIMEEFMPSATLSTTKGIQEQAPIITAVDPVTAASSSSSSPPPLSLTYAGSDKNKKITKWLRVGDDVQVYIRSVSKQSNQFTVTTSPEAVQGRTAKDLKKNDDAQKRLERLEKKLGGSLEKIWALEGKECTGTVRATSQSGDWVYVQPDLQGLPVGVATFLPGSGGSDAAGSLVAGDSVRVRISGIDEQRGQLSMHVLKKLAP